MSKALIVTSYIARLDSMRIKKNHYDFIISVDGGIKYCEHLSLNPNLLIGDWDSFPRELLETEKSKIITLNREKDYSDTKFALDYAIKAEYDEIVILGGLGGRFDHTMGAISLLGEHPIDQKSAANVFIMDGQNLVYVLSPGEYKIPPRDYKYLGIISYSDSCSNLTVTGVKYPLHNFTLTNTTSLGISNEITDKNARISFDNGKLMIIHSYD